MVAVLKDAVTPDGWPETLKVTDPVNLFMRLIVTIEAAVPPRTTFHPPGATVNMKSLVPTPASAVMVLLPRGVPQPVHRSYPTVAGNRVGFLGQKLLPVVMSWKALA